MFEELMDQLRVRGTVAINLFKIAVTEAPKRIFLSQSILSETKKGADARALAALCPHRGRNGIR